MKSKLGIFFLGLAFMLGGILAFSYFFNNNTEIKKTDVSFDGNRNSIIEIQPPKINLEERTEIPKTFLIKKVPFAVQAPFANWDEYHEEACEEASLVMLKYFKDGKALTPDLAEKEILSMIKFEIKKYGDYRDSDAEGIVKLAKDFYGLELRIVYDFEKTDIKKQLSKGSPILIPAAGRELRNPNFKSPGPLYHALVLVGYDENTIIANDPGTRRGEGYRYNIDILYGAIHDFPGSREKIATGKKAMLILP